MRILSGLWTLSIAPSRLIHTYTEAWLDLATMYELEGNVDATRDAYWRAKQSYPVSAEVAWRYGNYLLRTGDLPHAFEELHRAVQADPGRAALAFSRVYRADPNLDDLLAKVLPAQSDVYLGVIAEATSAKQLGVALEVWEKLLMLHPHLRIGRFRRVREHTSGRRRGRRCTAHLGTGSCHHESAATASAARFRHLGSKF